MEQFVVHLLMSFSPLNLPYLFSAFLWFKAFTFLFVKKFLVKFMEASLLHKNLPSTYPLDGKLPPPSKRCSTSPDSTFFEISNVPICWRGCVLYQKSSLNFVHIFYDLVFLQYWNMSYTICFEYYTLYIFTPISDSSAKIYIPTYLF